MDNARLEGYCALEVGHWGSITAQALYSDQTCWCQSWIFPVAIVHGECIGCNLAQLTLLTGKTPKSKYDRVDHMFIDAAPIWLVQLASI